MAASIQLDHSQIDRSRSFVDRARRLVDKGYIDSALDLIYDQIDERLRKEAFRDIDAILANLPVSELSIDLLLGILTATLPARTRLANRPKLFFDAKRILEDRAEFEEGLLTGLE